MSFQEKVALIKEKAETLDEALYEIQAEYLFKRYQYMAFSDMLRMKWELVAVGL